MIDDTGALGVVDTSVIVEGSLKLGRYSITYEDLNVDVGGLPIQVLRTYDTLNRTESGDFGFGWDLDLANFRISSNGALGFAGWQEVSCGRSGFFFTELCFQSSREHFVSVTWPDGRVESFDFTPDGGGNFFPGLGLAEYTAKDERTTSTLSPAPGNSNLFYDRQSGHLLGGSFGNGGIYDPSRWVLTDRFGTQEQSAGVLALPSGHSCSPQAVQTLGQTLELRCCEAARPARPARRLAPPRLSRSML